MTILWFMDRLGLPGQYHRTWVRLLRDNYVPTDEIRVAQLHKLLAPRTLLTTLGSRKAPTWVPAEEERITSTIDAAIAHTQARLVVLSSPESLACLGLAPEHATLHNLRGSVYWRSGIPHLVMLPMSAWFSMVTQKEIGGANYGFESKETFAAARSGHGEVHAESGSGKDSNATRPDLHGEGRAVLHGQSPSGAGKSRPIDRIHTSSGVGVRQALHVEGVSTRSGPQGVPIRDTSAGALAAQANAQATPSTPPTLVAGNLGRWGHLLGNPADKPKPSASSGVIDQRSFDYHLQNAGDLGDDESEDAGRQSDSSDYARVFADRYRDESPRPSEEPIDDDADESDAGEDGLPSDGVESDGSGEDGSDGSESTTEVDRSEGEMDEFFYEPVLSPVGRFVLIADTQKLFRLLRDGKNAAGPGRPIEVNWR